MPRKKKYAGKVTEELRKIYKDAFDEGIWIKEFASSENGKYYMAGAGSIEKLKEIGKKLGREIEISELSLDNFVNLSAPGTGKTREEACRNAVAAFKKHKK